MRVKICAIPESDTNPLYIDLQENVLVIMGWKHGDMLKIEPVVDRDGRVVHAILEKV